MTVNVIANQAISQTNLKFELDANNNNHPGFGSVPDMTKYAKKHRQTKEELLYWSAQIIGIYEFGNVPFKEGINKNFADMDNDEPGTGRDTEIRPARPDVAGHQGCSRR